MKKIVGIVAAASLVAGLAFADGPTANLAVTDFTGSAAVQWGVDLDSGTTGFKNTEYMKFVINLFDAGTKATSSDNDVWAELVLKAGNTKDWSHKLFGYGDGGGADGYVDFTADGQVLPPTNGAGRGVSFDIDTAKIHFGDFYVGIQNGDTVTGEYKFDGAIRGFDHWKGQGKWLNNVGPAGYTQGIVAGYGNNNFGVDVDFRSAPDSNKNQYTSNYALAAELKLKDSNEFAEGLFVDLGGSVNLSESKFSAGSKKDGTPAKTELLFGKLPDAADGVTCTPVTAFGAENAATTQNEGWYIKTTAAKAGSDTTGEAVEEKFNTRTIGYSGNLGYKFKIDDKYWLKPSVAFTGTYGTSHTANTNVTTTGNAIDLVAGLMFGWGSAQDANGGVYYFDADHQSRKVCPGVSVVAKIPVPSVSTTTTPSTTTTKTTHDLVQALIVPSFYTNGELVEGLKAAVYSEIALLNGTASTDANVVKPVAADKDDTFALALAAAVAYDIKADDITVTPQVGFRFVNTAYADNKIGENYEPLKNDAFFTNLGDQKPVAAGEKRAGLYENGFFNLKAGVNVNGLINNTDLFLVYQSANLMNGIDYSTKKNADGTAKKFYNVKAGTLNVGCKISF